jgi:hypothetical protein
MHCFETQTKLLEVVAGFVAQVKDNFPIVALAFAGLQALYGVAADALETPTIEPARTSSAIDIAETFFDIHTSTKFTQEPQIFVVLIWQFYLWRCKLLGRKSMCASEITVNI